MRKKILSNIAYVFFVILLVFATQWGVSTSVVTTADAQFDIQGILACGVVGSVGDQRCKEEEEKEKKEEEERKKAKKDPEKCIERLDKLQTRISELENAHNKWDQDVKQHECTRPYLGKAFRGAEYGRYGDSADPKPGKGDIEKAERAMNSAGQLAKAACKNIGEPSVKDIMNSLKRRLNDIKNKGSLECRQIEVRVRCINEAIEFYAGKSKMEWDEADKQKKRLDDRLNTERDEMRARCTPTEISPDGKPAPSPTSTSSTTDGEANKQANEIGEALDVLTGGKSTSPPPETDIGKGDETEGSSPDRHEGTTAHPRGYKCSLYNEERYFNDKHYMDWWREYCRN